MTGVPRAALVRTGASPPHPEASTGPACLDQVAHPALRLSGTPPRVRGGLAAGRTVAVAGRSRPGLPGLRNVGTGAYGDLYGVLARCEHGGALAGTARAASSVRGCGDGAPRGQGRAPGAGYSAARGARLLVGGPGHGVSDSAGVASVGGCRGRRGTGAGVEPRRGSGRDGPGCRPSWQRPGRLSGGRGYRRFACHRRVIADRDEMRFVRERSIPDDARDAGGRAASRRTGSQKNPCPASASRNLECVDVVVAVVDRDSADSLVLLAVRSWQPASASWL
jgi:hypothetical protein